MIRTTALLATLFIAVPATAQLTGRTASMGSVSSTTTGTTAGGTAGNSLGIGNGSGTLSGGTATGAAGAIPDVAGSSLGQPGTPLGSQSSLSARVNARAGIASASRLNTRLATGTAGYGGVTTGGAASGTNAVAGLSAGTTLSNAGQPSGAALGTGN